MRTNRVGFLGQVAFYIYDFDDFPARLASIIIGRKDHNDFVYKGYSGDVKCAGRPNADLMMMPEYRFWRKHFDLYVGSRLMSENPYEAQIWGYATREELEKRGYVDDFSYGPTRCYRLEEEKSSKSKKKCGSES